jgi:type 1 glutamine amidotransferase
MLGGQFSIEEEFYAFRENPRPRVHVLLRLDAASVGGAGDYPLAWTREQGNGRVYYNALGHFAATWGQPLFQQQILGAILWAAHR